MSETVCIPLTKCFLVFPSQVLLAGCSYMSAMPFIKRGIEEYWKEEVNEREQIETERKRSLGTIKANETSEKDILTTIKQGQKVAQTAFAEINKNRSEYYEGLKAKNKELRDEMDKQRQVLEAMLANIPSLMGVPSAQLFLEANSSPNRSELDTESARPEVQDTDFEINLMGGQNTQLALESNSSPNSELDIESANNLNNNKIIIKIIEVKKINEGGASLRS